MQADIGIVLNTNTQSLDLLVTGSGNVDVNNTGNLDLTKIVVADGSVTISNFGNLTATHVYTQGSSDRNDITLTTYELGEGADLIVKTLQTDDRGDITLNAQGDVEQDGGLLTSDETYGVPSQVRLL